jgi:colanic acid/amylovoran biosynthesis protein
VKTLFYAEEDNVIVVDGEINCVDFQNIASSFDFVIASRYHSVVHSYKAKTPVLVLGWAIKYRDLTAAFEQSRFCYDVRSALDFSIIEDQLKYLVCHYADESKVIEKHLVEIQQVNVFDYLKLNTRC